MTTTRRELIKGGAAAAAVAGVAANATAATLPTLPGTGRSIKVPKPASFTPDRTSLTAGYSTPGCFRDAKFGM
ncbi:hypothetical protein [Sphingobium lactosutens]|uniref:hypothetical protein n=1 Tax=Sphingobium lactosutens TaxID=522773 RepID=UPI0015BEDD4F|nr:hypothetical protein [Sphingobium lactosutens]